MTIMNIKTNMTRRLTLFTTVTVAMSVAGCTGDGSAELSVDEGVVVSAVDTHAGLAEVVVQQTRDHCGSTFSLEAGNRQASGVYVVGAYPEPTRGKIIKAFPEAEDVLAFIDANLDLLSQPAHTLGTYCEGANGNDCHKDAQLTCYLDISRETASLSDAARLARACNQKSIALLAEDGVKIIDQEAGQPFGDGKGLAGAAIAPCAAARSGTP